MPHAIYVIPQVNAWVAQRGGVLGIRSRRVMAIGLPLLSILTVSELRAVLAHEFGHFYAGDTKLAPVVYWTRYSIAQMLDNLNTRYAAWLYLFITPYAEIFLKIIQDISRKQELIADELAARVAGDRTAITALQTVFAGNDAFKGYWQGVIMPLLKANICPLILEGFSHFVTAGTISGALSQKIERELREGRTETYDSHPTLPERIAAIKKLSAGDVAEDGRRAITLFGDLEDFERDMTLKFLTSGILRANKRIEMPEKEAKRLAQARIAKLRFVPWGEATTRAYLPMWEETIRKYARGLEGITPTALPEVAKDFSLFGMNMLKKANRGWEHDSLSERTSSAIGAALAVALYRAGWDLRVTPGQPVCLENGGQRIMPFEVLGKLRSHVISAQEWRATCAEASITDMDLGRLVKSDA